MIYDGPGDTILRPLNGINYGPLWTDRYPLKLVLHTTETVGLPGYNNGAHAPHITIDTLARKVWQHVLLDARCGALRGSTAVFNDTGVRTVMNEVAVQVEIIGYSDRNTVINFGGNRRWVGDFQDYDYEFIAGVVAYLLKTCGIGNDIHALPSGKSWSYGINSPHRLAPVAWEQLAGTTAHGGVFGQKHWDTGVLDLNRIWQQAQEMDMPTPQEIAHAVWSFPGLAVDGPNVSTQLMLSRVHRGVNALVVALQRGDLTVDPAEIAEGLVQASPALAKSVADEITRRLAS